MILLWLGSGISPIEAVREFRNHFFPVILFFIARKTLVSPKYRVKISNLFSLIFFVFLFVILIEFVLIKIFGYSPYIFPWYRYTFVFSDRYVDNIIGGPSFIMPEDTPILGPCGWPHATAATLMVLFAFSYPYLLKKSSQNDFNYNSLLIMRLPIWIRYSIVFLTATLIYFILGVKMHMITFIFVVLFLPYFIINKELGRYTIIILVLFIIVLSNNFIQETLLTAATHGFITTGWGRDASIASILSVNPISAIFNMPIKSIFIGDWSGHVGSELRLLNYTLRYGLIWFCLFISMFIVGYFYVRKILSDRYVNSSDRLFAIGSIGLLAVCLLDMGHYARAMVWPIIDIFAVCLGCLTSIRAEQISRG